MREVQRRKMILGLGLIAHFAIGLAVILLDVIDLDD